ncbi:MAG: ATP-binding protein [Myxococcales bacterium]|nr:ATP-binding protein [Myxococcales bacterium]
MAKPLGFARASDARALGGIPASATERNKLLAALQQKHAELETRNASLEAINAVANAVSESLDYHVVVMRAVDALAEYTDPLAIAVLAKSDPDEGTGAPSGLRVVHHRRLSAEAVAALEGSRDDGAVIDRVMRGQVALASEGANEGLCRELAPMGGRSWVAVPLSAHDQGLGVLVMAFEDTRVPLECERDTLVSIGKTVGMAMFNAEQVACIEAAIHEREAALQARAHLEMQLRQAQRVETIGRLAGGIAHDFNNILTPILTAAQLGQDDVPPENEDLREDLQMIVSSAERAAELVRQILLFSRDVRPDRRPVDCAPILREALRLVRASLPVTIELRQQFEANVGRVRADAVQLHQVILNLCMNAAHAMSDGDGVLTVSLDSDKGDERLARAHPELLAGPVAHIAVRDTGSGMDPATADRVFEPFFTTKEVGEGSGLGLSVVHGIIANHDGCVEVESEPGVGTSCHIYLPCLVDEAVHPSIPPARPRMGRERILLVDDETSVARVATRILKRLGYDVICTSSSREALDTFRAHPFDFDLVLTDQTMPHLTGQDLCSHLRELRSDIRVVLMTGYSGEDGQVRGADPRVRVDGVLLKPFDAVSLGETLREVLDRRD